MTKYFVILAALFSINVRAELKRADVLHCSAEVTRQLGGGAYQNFEVATMITEFDQSLSGSSMSGASIKYKGHNYTMGFGWGSESSGLTATKYLSGKTIALVQDNASIVSLDLSDLLEELNKGAKVYWASKRSGVVSIDAQETVQIVCYGDNMKSMLTSMLEVFKNNQNQQIFKMNKEQ